MNRIILLTVNYLTFFSQAVLGATKEYALKFPNNCTAKEIIYIKQAQATITFHHCSPCDNFNFTNATSVSLLMHTLAPVPTKRPTNPHARPTRQPKPISLTPRPSIPTLLPTSSATLPPVTDKPQDTKRPTKRPTHPHKLKHTKPPFKPTCPPTHAHSEKFSVKYTVLADHPTLNNPPHLEGFTVVFPDGCLGHQMMYADGSAVIQLNDCTICGPAITKTPHSHKPSQYPTILPTATPSMVPSNAPTLNPTPKPTKYPTKHPVTHHRPSKPPTHKPTCGCQNDLAPDHQRGLLFSNFSNQPKRNITVAQLKKLRRLRLKPS